MSATPLGPTRVARRQITLDRLVETLTGWGSPHADHRARALLDQLEDLGWSLPPALDDPPPARVQPADPAHQAAAMAEIRATLEALRNRPRTT